MNTAKQLDELVARVRTLPAEREQEVIAVPALPGSVEKKQAAA
jgi:hypothetical protein